MELSLDITASVLIMVNWCAQQGVQVPRCHDSCIALVCTPSIMYIQSYSNLSWYSMAWFWLVLLRGLHVSNGCQVAWFVHANLIPNGWHPALKWSWQFQAVLQVCISWENQSSGCSLHAVRGLVGISSWAFLMTYDLCIANNLHSSSYTILIVAASVSVQSTCGCGYAWFIRSLPANKTPQVMMQSQGEVSVVSLQYNLTKTSTGLAELLLSVTLLSWPDVLIKILLLLGFILDMLPYRSPYWNPGPGIQNYGLMS